MSVDEEISGLRESGRLESSFMIYGDRCIKILNFCRMFLCIERWSFNYIGRREDRILECNVRFYWNRFLLQYN